jgi:hypothetical protein
VPDSDELGVTNRSNAHINPSMMLDATLDPLRT